MKIVFMTVSSTAISSSIQAASTIRRTHGDVLDLKIYNAYIKTDAKTRDQISKDIEEADLTLVDLMGADPNLVASVYAGLDMTRGDVVPLGADAREYLKLGAFTARGMNKGDTKEMPDMKKMQMMRQVGEKAGKFLGGRMRDMRNYSLISKYFIVGDYKNILNMFLLLLKYYGGLKIQNPQEPDELLDFALYDLDTHAQYKTYREYLKGRPYDADKPTVALIFHSHNYPTDNHRAIGKIKDRLAEHFNTIPLAMNRNYTSDGSELRKFLIRQAPGKVDLILSFMPFRLSQGPMGGDATQAVDVLNEAEALYLHPMFITKRTEADWKAEVRGLNPSETMISVMMPELDGAIDIMPVGAVAIGDYSQEHQLHTSTIDIIEERVEALVDKCLGYVRLRRKENRDKRIALICYNYPPGEGNIFGGAFLDTFESVAKVLKTLKAADYSLAPMDAEELKEKFSAGHLVNMPNYGDYSRDYIRYDGGSYQKRLSQSPNYQKTVAKWGQAPGDLMTDRGQFLIPGVIDGNIFIGLQPARSRSDNPKDYHDKEVPPHHQYSAFYTYLKDEFKADAIIHVGTHGTLEFLPGKESGMSGDCYPEKLLGNIPHFYLYYVGNPSEATIAKRRSRATILSYQPPIFVPGKLYGDYTKLSTLIDNYHQALSINVAAGKDILNDIYALAEELNLDKDLDVIESELYRMKSSLIPKGLHIYGTPFTREESITYAKGVLRHGFGKGESLKDLCADILGYSPADLEEENNVPALEAIDAYTEQLFDAYLSDQSLAGFDIGKEAADRVRPLLDRGLTYVTHAQKNSELENLIHALDGKYVKTKFSGDIYRNPEILPTGYNTYQFDPKLVPTRAAYSRGQAITQNLLDAYLKEKGRYPLSTAVILWGLETSKTQGESFSQILSSLGVRVIDTGENWAPKYEIIPIEELGRPRVDVTINICGFFRDMFPNLIENLSDILIALANLDESDEENYFKKNSKKIYQFLKDKGYGEEEALELSVTRIFGPEAGSYGTGITDIIESKNWEEETEIGTVFLDNLQYAYSRNFHGEKVADLYKENLKEVEIVSQIRSSNEYEITDLDHYYEFFGGLSKSVEMTRGKKAKMMITDVTGDRIFSESIEKSIARGIRTRVLNPQWIDGLLEHDKQGTQIINDRFENVMGLAATTGAVEQWVYNELHSQYVDDEALRNRLIENNQYAYMNILDRMMEYYRRGYWEATEEQIQKIKDLYLELEHQMEGEI